MIGAQTREHGSVDLGMEDPFDDDVETVIEGEARRHVDVGHAQGTRVIAHVQDLATQHVVTDDRHSTRASLPDGLRQTRFPAARVASDDDQSRGR